jgi:hypothetical protein
MKCLLQNFGNNGNDIFKIIEQAGSLIYTLINVYIYTAVLIYIIYLCISSHLHGFPYCYICGLYWLQYYVIHKYTCICVVHKYNPIGCYPWEYPGIICFMYIVWSIFFSFSRDYYAYFWHYYAGKA